MNLSRIALTIGAGLAAGVLSMLIVVIADLYLTGHGYGSLRREIVAWPAAGVHLSAGDIIFLSTIVVTAWLVWRRGR